MKQSQTIGYAANPATSDRIRVIVAGERRYRFDGHPPRVVARPRWVDTDKEWRPLVRDLANELHFETKGVWFWFRQISLSIFHEAGWPQECAEAWAMHCLRAVFDKRGQEPS